MDISRLLPTIEESLTQASWEECVLFVGDLERLKAMAWGKIVAGKASQSSSEGTNLITIAEAAARLSIPESRAYELARQGKLPAVRIGKYVRVSAKALAAYQANLPKA